MQSMAEYTIHKLALLSGVSSRTLRHYDEIGLLHPLRKNESGYRIYGEKEADILQQILLHKTCGMDLKTIRKILHAPDFKIVSALKAQKEILLKQQQKTQEIIQTIEKTIATHTGGDPMNTAQKFTGLKDKLIAENDAKYGEEVKARWGEDTYIKSNQKFKDMTQEQFDHAAKLDTDFHTVLSEAFETGNPASETAQKAVELHKQWLMIYWPTYSKEAHIGITQMYLTDERFLHYFGNNHELAQFLADAVTIS